MGTLMEPPASTGHQSLHLSTNVIQLTNGDEVIHNVDGQNNNYMIRENEKPVLPGVIVRAASLDMLVKFCINCFEPSGEISAEHSNFPKVFFLMHKWFSTSEEIITLLVELYHDAESSAFSCACCGSDSSIKYYQKCQCCIKICHAFRFWIQTFPVQFGMEPKLIPILEKFQMELINSGNRNHSNLVDISKIPSYEWMKMSVRNPMPKHNRKVSLVFNHLEPNELAEHLTYLEHKVMRRINFQDFKNYAVSGLLKDNAKLERSIALFNGLSQWIQCMVLNRTNPQQRADVIVKFVKVAERLLELKNFNTLMAVVGGLSHSAIARLSKTFACIPADTQKSLVDMTELLSSASNFANYRRMLSESQGFRIPILGVHMKDLISLHVALPDYLEGQLINFRKMAQLSFIFQELIELQNSSPSIDASMDLVKTLRLSLDMAYTEDEIYELSFAKEPRNPTSPQTSPTHSVVFAEWAAGITSVPDPATIRKHVHSMVEAVFKNYDNDRDGYISQEEFEAIAGNFPFIDSFCVLDADHDGMISKNEMIDYYIRANCHALRNGFKHDFHETTYFKPTYCSHCTGLLWGLIKQGHKCKDCGINAHKHCKDLVVMECRRIQNTSHGRSLSVSGTSDATISRARMRNRRRLQKSLPSESDTPPSPSPSSLSSNGCKYENSENAESEIRQRLAHTEEVQISGPRPTIERKFTFESPTVRCQQRAASFETSYSETTTTNSLFHSESDGNSEHAERYRSMSS